MKILIVGGNGFIGRHIARAAIGQGHQVVRGVRREKMEPTNTIACDMQRDVIVKTWLPRLTNIDAVINCVGVLRATKQVMQAAHCDAPAALASACAESKKPFLHVSALGLNNAADTPYLPNAMVTTPCVRHILARLSCGLRWYLAMIRPPPSCC